ncbi:MAG: radical SAM protein [Candidatus Fermentibacteraceae bacterium]
MPETGWVELRHNCFVNPFSIEFFFGGSPPADGPVSPPPEPSLRLRAVQAVVTGRCNLMCSYCSARIAGGFKGDMDHATLDAVLSHSDPDSLLLVTGGEPLLHPKAVRTLIRGWSGQSVLFTNGALLDRRTALFLKEHGTALVVSMDGFESEHNRFRGDSWKAAAAALDLARETGLPAGISLVAGSHNAGSLPESLYGLLKRFKPASFGVNIQHYTPDAFSPISADEYSRIILGAYRFSLETGVFVDQVARRLLPIVTGHFRHRDCAAQGGKIVFRPDGSASSCVNTRGIEQWGNRNPVNYPVCAGCPALGVCGGGCTWDGIHLTSDGCGPDPRNCVWTLDLLRAVSETVEERLPRSVARPSRSFLASLFENLCRRAGAPLAQSLGHGEEDR